MANINARVFPAASWVPRAQWAIADRRTRDKYLARVGEILATAKRSQIRRGIGADGKPLPPVKPSSRPDGATGKPLDPHHGESRSVKWLRATRGSKAGTVTLHWSHGFGKILGYHAAGAVIGAYIRNVVDFYPTLERKVIADARQYWRGLMRMGGLMPLPTPRTPRKPPPAPEPRRVTPMRRRVPVAAQRRPGARP